MKMNSTDLNSTNSTPFSAVMRAQRNNTTADTVGAAAETAAAMLLNGEKKRERRPDRAVYVPRARRWQTNASSTVQTLGEEATDNCLNEHALNMNTGDFILHASSHDTAMLKKQQQHPLKKIDEQDRKRLKKIEIAALQSTTLKTNKLDKPQMKKNACDSICTVLKNDNTGNEDNKMLAQNCDNRNHSENQLTAETPIETELSNCYSISNDSSTIVNETNLSNQSYKSHNQRNDEAKINKKNNELNSPNTCDTAQQQQCHCLPEENGLNLNGTLNGTDVSQDDWENMFDDKGECLNPQVLTDLTVSMAKIDVNDTKMNCDAFHANQMLLNEEEFPHVLEVSNFPIEFKTHDLLLAFSQYKQSGFEIRWVDETHALAVFSNSTIAAEVLTQRYPFVIVKPLSVASAESRLKAKKCANSLQPYKARPETCAVLARRLVTSALGVRLKTDVAQREKEQRVLQAAKERKLMAAKYRDEAWES